MTDEELDAIRARLAGATPGLWWTRGAIATTIESARIGIIGEVRHAENAALIAHAPADIANLLAEVERLRAGRDTLLATLAEIAALNGGDIETNHIQADDALVAYIDDPEIMHAYEAIDKWYA